MSYNLIAIPKNNKIKKTRFNINRCLTLSLFRGNNPVSVKVWIVTITQINVMKNNAIKNFVFDNNLVI